jgi:hypothetical protein
MARNERSRGSDNGAIASWGSAAYPMVKSRDLPQMEALLSRIVQRHESIGLYIPLSVHDRNCNDMLIFCRLCQNSRMPMEAGQAGATLYRNWHMEILRASRATHDTKHERQQNKVAQGNGEPCGAEEVLEKLRPSPTTRLFGRPCQLPPYDLDGNDHEKHFRSSLMPLQ